MISPDVFAFIYLIAGVLFTLGLKGLSHPSTARNGNLSAMIGMALAIVTTLLDPNVKSYGSIILAMVIGGVIGTIIANKIEMKSMPQLVAAFHSLVGLAAVLIAIGTYLSHKAQGPVAGLLMT